MIRALPFAAALLALAAGACTDADLYSVDRPPKEPDRVALTGRVCADDPVTARYPLRVVLLVDQAAGPLFSDFDPAGQRIGILTSFVQSSLSSPNVSLAVVGYAAGARKLAPTEGAFTRNPGELLNALNLLSIAQPCVGPDQCRDYLDGIRSARALIEADMARLSAGARVLTQYVIIHVSAGLHEPRVTGCDVGDAGPWACQYQREVGEVTALREAIAASGAAGLRYHVIHLAAYPDDADNDALGEGMKRVALAGRGLYQRFDAVGGLGAEALSLLDVRTVLRAKHLIVANIHAKPTPSGPVPDTDADGLSDAEEATTGTSPGSRDTDGDGIGDLVEVITGLRPLEVDLPVACEGIQPDIDTDRDGLSDCDELLIGTDRSLIDSDGDGSPDRLELTAAIDYLHPDAELDADGDGTSNGEELRLHSDPRSSDVTLALSQAYDYDIVDEGVVEERFAATPRRVTGVEILHVSDGTTPGLATLQWIPDPPAFAYKDAGEGVQGPLIPWSGEETLELPAGSWSPLQGEDGSRITIRIDGAALPPAATIEQIRVILRERDCVTWTVRNVRLMPTGVLDDEPEAGAGRNDVIIYFAQAPEGRLEIPGPFRLAAIPIRLVSPLRREPDDAVIEVFDDEFLTPRLTF